MSKNRGTPPQSHRSRLQVGSLTATSLETPSRLSGDLDITSIIAENTPLLAGGGMTMRCQSGIRSTLDKDNI